MKALITGAAGFVGKHLSREMLKEKHEVIAFDRRICDVGTKCVQGDIASFDFDDILNDVDVVFHLASLLGTVELFHRTIEAERVNVLGTLNLLEAMRRSDVDKIVFTSKPNIWKYNVYTITKETCERYLEMFRRVYGMKTVIAKPFNIYGPEEKLTEYRKAVPYFVLAALKGEPLEIFGDGEQTMDPIYVDDAVNALIRCATVLPEETVEIGSMKPVKVRNLARKVLAITDSKSELVYRPMRKGETEVCKIFANGNMERLINFSPETDLEHGLRKTIDWYSRHLQDFKEVYHFTKEDFQDK